ncbi:MAG: glycosyltransferase family 4 protein [Promethearchaeota archaeon]
MSDKRVAIFVEHFPPYLGSDRTIYELGRRLPEHGYKVHFIVTQPLRYLLGRRPDDWEYKKVWQTGPPDLGENISAKYLLLPKVIERFWQKKTFFAFPITLLYFFLLAMIQLIRFKADVVISAHATPIVGVVAAFSARFLRRPLIMGCPDWMTAYAAQLSRKKMANVGILLLQTLEVLLIKLAKSSFTVTHYMKRVLVLQGIKKESIVVIPNGVDSHLFSNSFDVSELKRGYGIDGRVVVLFSGHIEEWAGLKMIETLTKRLSEEVPEALLLLIGAGEAVEKLVSFVESAGVSNQFQYGGIKPFSEMPRIISSADIALCIFPDTPVSHAASPLKLFEYMSCGKAIVATSVSGTAEALTRDAGILVEPGNVDEICDKVVELCRSPKQREELGQKARELVLQEYSWSVLVEDLTTLISMTVNDKSVSS